MSENVLLDRSLYRTIKNMNKSELNQFIHNVYDAGKEDAISEIEVTEINIEKIHTEISEINGIGKTRSNKIMDIILKNIWHFFELYRIYKKYIRM